MREPSAPLPRASLVDPALLAQVRQAVLEISMLTASALDQALGHLGRDGRARTEALRLNGELLGIPLPDGRTHLYPAFQVDVFGQRVWPTVIEVNRSLRAARDPWAAGAWWVTPVPRLRGRAPMDIVGSPRDRDLLVVRSTQQGPDPYQMRT